MLAMCVLALGAVLVGGAAAPIGDTASSASVTPADDAGADRAYGGQPRSPGAAGDGAPGMEGAGAVAPLAGGAGGPADTDPPRSPGARVGLARDADTRESSGPDEEPEPVVATEAPEGYLVLEGARAGGSGPQRTFTVEVEPGLEVEARELSAMVHEALLDEEASWARDRELVQDTDPATADLRIVLATPATVDARCGEAGLDTAGSHSCWDGERAMLNIDRWRYGVEHVDDLDTYRLYLINHEVGHGLGRGHVDCTGAGEPAPVMMQQTLGLGDCEPNPWPHP